MWRISLHASGHEIEKMLASKVWELQWVLVWFAAQWARQDSNLRPTGYEPAALPLSYEPILPPMQSSTFHGNQICVERETGLEPATPCLEGRNSTTELLPQNRIYFTSNIIVGKQEEGFTASGQPQQRCLGSRYSKLDCSEGKGVSSRYTGAT